MKKLALILFSFMLFPIPVFAEGESCTSNEDCAEGEYCMMLPAALTRDCPPCEGDDCPPCDEGEGKGEESEGECKKPKAPEPPPEALLCETGSDCPLGFQCEERKYGCKNMGQQMPPSTPDMPGTESSEDCACECEPGDAKCEEECDCDEEGDSKGENGDDPTPQDGGQGFPCEPLVVNICVFDKSSCDSDADCADGFVCHSVEECTRQGFKPCICPEGEDECPCDDEPEPENVEPECNVVATLCVPGETPCTEDEDCLDGWSCQSKPGGIKEERTELPPVQVPAPTPTDEETDDEETDEGEAKEAEADDGKRFEGELDEEKMCIPDGWVEMIGAMGGAMEEGAMDREDAAPMAALFDDNEAASGSGAGGDEGGSSEGPNTDADEAKDAASGLCSLGHSGRFGAAAFVLLLLFAGALASRREHFEG